MPTKKSYFIVETFAIGDVGGGCWETDQIVSGSTPAKAFAKALKLVKAQGFAAETTIKACKRNGESFA